MSAPLQLLIIDDSAQDAELMARAVTTGGFTVQWKRVDSPAALSAQLDAQKWDAILSDYALALFQERETLTLWKSKNIDTPFLIVSSVIDAKKAVAALKAGAHDWLHKSDLHRLASAIERERQETLQRRALTQRHRAFSKLSQNLSTARSPREAARIITTVADELLGWDSCFVDLYAPAQDKFYHVYDVDIVDGHRQELTPEDWGQKPTPMLLKVAECGPQLILRDVAAFSPHDFRPFGDKGRPSASIMAVPIHHQSQLLGFVSIQSYTPKKYQPEDLETLQTLADHGAGALERIRAAEELRASEKRYRILFDSNPGPIFVVDRDTLKILAANPATMRLYGYSRAEFLRKPLSAIRPTAPAHGPSQKQAAWRSAKKHDGVERHQKKDGSWIDVETVSLPLVFADRPARLFMVTDMTERKTLEKGILEISTREQRRIGHDLHDGLSQHLAGVGFLSQILTEQLREKSAPETLAAQKITDLLSAAVSKSRHLARGLFPVRLEDNGLVSALEELAASTESLFRVRCHFACHEPVLMRDNALAENLYYIAQEALMNGLKHGKARKLWIRLLVKNEKFTLSVRDDGCGFPPTAIASQGMGLRIMKYRANLIGATLEIQTPPAGGTSVICSFLRSEIDPAKV